MINRTKIVVALSKKTSDRESIKEILLAGANVVFFNLSQETLETHQQRKDIIEHLNDQFRLSVATIAFVSNNHKELEFAVTNDFDFIAYTATNSKELIDIRERINALGGKDIQLISRLTNHESIPNIDEILKVSDASLFDSESIYQSSTSYTPTLLEYVTESALKVGKPIIVQTGLSSDSKVSNINNIYLNIKNGVSALLVDAYSKDFIQNLKHQLIACESEIDYIPFSQNYYIGKNNEDAMAESAVLMVNNYDIEMLLAENKKIARSLSKYHPYAPIISVLKNTKEARSLSLNFGVIGVLSKDEAADKFIELGLQSGSFVLEVTKNKTELLQLK